MIKLLTSKLPHWYNTLLLHIMNPETSKALHLLKDGYKTEFATKVFEDDRFFELLMNMSIDFVDDNIPIVDDEIRHDLALLLCESVKLGNF